MTIGTRCALATWAVLLLSGCSWMPDVPPPPAFADRDIPLGPPRYAKPSPADENLSPVDRAVRALRADVFSFIRTSPQVAALELLIRTENVSLLAANDDAGPAARVYH